MPCEMAQFLNTDGPSFETGNRPRASARPFVDPIVHLRLRVRQSFPGNKVTAPRSHDPAGAKERRERHPAAINKEPILTFSALPMPNFNAFIHRHTRWIRTSRKAVSI